MNLNLKIWIFNNSGFFCAFCRKLISPKMAKTHFTEGKTHFTEGKTHFTNSKTNVSKPKNLAFSLVLLNLSSIVTQIHSKYRKIGHIFHFGWDIWWKGQDFGKNWPNRLGKSPKLISQSAKTHFTNTQNSFFRHFAWVDVTGFRTKKACLKLTKCLCRTQIWIKKS